MVSICIGSGVIDVAISNARVYTKTDFRKNGFSNFSISKKTG